MATRFAGRLALGTPHPVCLRKDGQFHTRRISGRVSDGMSECVSDGVREETVLACGLACSEVVSGARLASVLQPGFEFEGAVLAALREEMGAPPLAVHTSAGVPEALEDFIEVLGEHLPWREGSSEGSSEGGSEGVGEWFVSLQVEGASAVLAAIDLMLQLRHFQTDSDSDLHQRGAGAGPGAGAAVESLGHWHIGVCATSYHGPPSSSPGASTPLFSLKHNQVIYPAPAARKSPLEGSVDEEYLLGFSAWLDEHHSSLGCLLVEPQWGSSAVARSWHPETLRQVIELCHKKGVLVVADEIMCGLGRHGQSRRNGDTSPTLFLSEAWALPVDAVTFGKAICAGAYPMSGVICRRGAKQLGSLGRSALQSHTYSGSNVRALMTAIEVLKLLPTLLPGVVMRGDILKTEMSDFEKCADGLFVTQGLGLMWGALVNRSHPLASDMPRLMAALRKGCAEHLILPYFVPAGGFMITPLFDVEPGVLREVGVRLKLALKCTIAILVSEAS